MLERKLLLALSQREDNAKGRRWASRRTEMCEESILRCLSARTNAQFTFRRKFKAEGFALTRKVTLLTKSNETSESY
ncbi:MAG: hypothetical protein ACTS5F_00605 [Candidatus Hodgkinia cicadicola]